MDERQTPISAVPKTEISIFDLWQKYEEIAMHFNDLLIRLRMQALGGVAALATIVSIFVKVETKNIRGSWEIAAFVFGALCLIWLAICVLDLLYYNRLLIGSVVAITELEAASKTGASVASIEMSTRIEQSVWNKLPGGLSLASRWYLLRGVFLFYGIVMAGLVTGFGISLSSAGLFPVASTFAGLCEFFRSLILKTP